MLTSVSADSFFRWKDFKGANKDLNSGILKIDDNICILSNEGPEFPNHLLITYMGYFDI